MLKPANQPPAIPLLNEKEKQLLQFIAAAFANIVLNKAAWKNVYDTLDTAAQAKVSAV